MMQAWDVAHNCLKSVHSGFLSYYCSLLKRDCKRVEATSRQCTPVPNTKTTESSVMIFTWLTGQTFGSGESIWPPSAALHHQTRFWSIFSPPTPQHPTPPHIFPIIFIFSSASVSRSSFTGLFFPSHVRSFQDNSLNTEICRKSH